MLGAPQGDWGCSIAARSSALLLGIPKGTGAPVRRGWIFQGESEWSTDVGGPGGQKGSPNTGVPSVTCRGLITYLRFILFLHH